MTTYVELKEYQRTSDAEPLVLISHTVYGFAGMFNFRVDECHHIKVITEDEYNAFVKEHGGTVAL